MLQDVRLQHELARAMRRSEAEQNPAVVPPSPHEQEVTRLTEWYFEKTRSEYWGREQQFQSEWAGYTQAQRDVMNVEIAEAKNMFAKSHKKHSYRYQSIENSFVIEVFQ